MDITFSRKKKKEEKEGSGMVVARHWEVGVLEVIDAYKTSALLKEF